MLLIQRGTFYGVTLELAMGFDRVNIVKAVIGGLSRRGKRGNGRARQWHRQHLKFLLIDTDGLSTLPLL